MILYNIYLIILLLSLGLCIYRAGACPEPPDRAAAASVVFTLTAGISALLSVILAADFYLDVTISIALLGYIAAIAQSGHLSKRREVK